jgi:hypothetical protein
MCRDLGERGLVSRRQAPGPPQHEPRADANACRPSTRQRRGGVGSMPPVRRHCCSHLIAVDGRYRSGPPRPGMTSGSRPWPRRSKECARAIEAGPLIQP